MSRSKGQDKAAGKRREGLELAQFSLRLMPDELALVRLRISQAIRRDERLAELLGPASETIERVLGWTSEAVEAIASVTYHPD